MKRWWVIIFGSYWWVGYRRETWYCGPNDSLYKMVKHPSAVGLTVPDDTASASRVKPKNWQYKLIWYHLTETALVWNLGIHSEKLVTLCAMTKLNKGTTLHKAQTEWIKKKKKDI